MRIRTRIAAALGATAMAVTGAVAVASPAEAAWSQCLANTVCAFTGTSGNHTAPATTPGPTPVSSPDLRSISQFTQAVSVYNHTVCKVRIFEGTYYTGAYTDIPANSAIVDLTGTPYYHHVYSVIFCV